MRFQKILTVFGVLVSLLCTPAGWAQKSKSSSTFAEQFVIRGDKVEFAHETKAKVGDPSKDIVFVPTDLTHPEHVRGPNQLLHSDAISTPVFDVADDAQVVVVTARSSLTAEEFAKVRVVLADPSSTQTTESFRGELRSLTFQPLRLAIPPGMQGRRGRVTLELLNPSNEEGQRCLFIREIRIGRGDAVVAKEAKP